MGFGAHPEIGLDPDKACLSRETLADPDDGDEGDRPIEPKNDDGVTPREMLIKITKTSDRQTPQLGSFPSIKVNKFELFVVTGQHT